jgi:AcrR family transcriptional regulator
MAGVNAARTARERARAELAREIKDTARAQLGRVGADGLSLRAVARELGMVSSALYRYFPSRDELLTALITDSYDALGAAAEAADRPGAEPRRRWASVCHAVRDWARAHPREYALIYGSPVPGYRAPETTVTPAARVPLVLLGVLAAAGPPATELPEPQSGLAQQLRSLSDTLPVELPQTVLARALIAWTQLFGMTSFELFGQLVGNVDPSDEFFDHAVAEMADFVGLPGPVAA